jgi:hypothetical protein
MNERTAVCRSSRHSQERYLYVHEGAGNWQAAAGAAAGTLGVAGSTEREGKDYPKSQVTGASRAGGFVNSWWRCVCIVPQPAVGVSGAVGPGGWPLARPEQISG